MSHPIGPNSNETRRLAYRIGLFAITVILVYFSLVLPIATRQVALPIQVGDVSDVDIVAPYSDTFVSNVLTQIARDEASNAIPDIYLPPDPAINKSQVTSLTESLDFINSIRSDQISESAQRESDLLSLSQIPLTQDEATYLLSLDQELWESIQKESILVLEQALRRSIRDSQVSEVKRNLPGFISFSFASDQISIINSLVSPFIVSNSILSETDTLTARKEAAAKVNPVTVSYIHNQVIISRGQLISSEQWEVLTHYNLVRNTQGVNDYVSKAAIVVVLAASIIIYSSKRKISCLHDFRNVLVIAIGLLLFLYAARALIPNRAVIPYFFPLPAFGLILVTLFNLEIGILFSLILSLLSTYGISVSPDLTIFYIVTSLLGVLSLWKGKNISSFIWSWIAISLSGILVLAAYRINDSSTDLFGLITLFGVAVLNGFASASLAMLLQFLLAQLLRLTTPLRLLELSRPDHPLLKHILLTAPGTYQHSLQVANLAEQAAESIGANAFLTRVGTIFHDIGKSKKADFFIENQVPGNIDTHDDLDPVFAAGIIIQHVTDGVQLADKYRLPPRLKDFIKEHHGTQVTKYQYNRAVLNNGNDPNQVDQELFSYPGPKPQTKETGILMLADKCEARARAELPKNDAELKKLIQSVIDSVMMDAQLENTNLTLRDLNIIKESFFKTLSNSYHPRIKYPELGIKDVANDESIK